MMTISPGNLAHKLSVDEPKCTGLARDHRLSPTPEHGMKAPRITDCDHGVLRHEDQRVGTVNTVKPSTRRLMNVPYCEPATRWRMTSVSEDVADAACFLEPSRRTAAFGIPLCATPMSVSPADHKWLDIPPTPLSRWSSGHGRSPCDRSGSRPCPRRHRRRASTPVRANEVPVGGCDTRAFLSSVLERVQSQVGQVGRLGVSEDTKHTALITKCIRSKLRVVGHWVATGSEGADSYPVATECAP